MDIARLRLKKNEDRRLRAGHSWIYSNEIDTAITPLKSFVKGQEVVIEAHDQTLLGVGYINPQSLITARLVSRNAKTRLDKELLVKRLQSTLVRRERFYSKPYYRLVFGESDFLPGLVVDRFGDHLAVQITTAGMDTKRADIIQALLIVLPNTLSILLRNDSSARKFEGLDSEVVAAFGIPPERILLEENSVTFSAPFWNGQKTGWFYDHRLNRARLKDYVMGEEVLDVFSYLGGFGVQAAVFGAEKVYCLDASALATDWIRENAHMNEVSEKVEVICDDAFVGLKKLQQNNKTFGVIILDPPAFVKKQKDKKEGLIAYQRLNEMALKLLKPNGILVSCSCSMHVTYDDLVQVIRRSSLRTERPVQIIERGHQAQDHPVHPAIPETDYLKMIVVS